MSRRHDLATLAIGLLTAAAVSAQRDSQRDNPTFRAGVHVVEVDARVFDRNGQFVKGLTSQSFELLEDGVPQHIVATYSIEGDMASDANASAATSASAAAVPGARQTWVFVFDLDRISPGASFERARAAVEAFFRHRFRDGDLGGVVAGGRMVNDRLTSVREELAAAAATVKPQAGRRSRDIELRGEWPRLQDEAEAIRIAAHDREALQRAVTRACADAADTCRQAPPDLQILEKARRFHRELQGATSRMLSALDALATGLARVPGPKTVVVVGEGFIVQELESTARGIVGQMARAGARVYAVDLRGLNRGAGAGIADQSAANDEAGGRSPVDVQDDGPNSLAVDTGGLSIRNHNDFTRALDIIRRDASRYYVLAYQPTNAAFDGRFRAIEVRTKRADLRVRARRGYLALEPARMLAPQPVPRSETNPAVDEAASVPVAAASLPEPVPPPVAAAGVVAPAPAAQPGTIRVRPNAAERVGALARGDAASAEWLSHRGWDAYQRGDLENALAAFNEAASQHGVRPWVLYAMGLSQAALGRYADAAASWERVRTAAPEFDTVYMDLADTYVQLGDLTEALGVLRAAEQRWPANPEVHNAVGVIHVRRGALDRAIAAFAKAAAAAPTEALAHFNLGRAYEMRFSRSMRYVSSQRRWVGSDEDRQKAAESYGRYIQLGGPYVNDAREALGRLDWAKK